MSAPGGLQKIRQRLASAPGRRVLVVEGASDVDFICWMLDKPPYLEVNTEAELLIAPAGGKEQVLAMLAHQPDWLGLVDRDAWDDAQCDAARRQHPNLRILPRFTLESYAIMPSELWAAMPEVWRAAIPGGEAALRSSITEGLPHAVAHGALWRVAQPLYEGLRALGFNDALLDYDRQIDQQTVYDILSGWHQYLAPEPLAVQFEAELSKARALPEDQLWRTWVHGKCFFQRRVYPMLSRARGAETGDPLRLLMRRMHVPSDISPLLNELCGGCV